MTNRGAPFSQTPIYDHLTPSKKAKNYADGLQQ